MSLQERFLAAEAAYTSAVAALQAAELAYKDGAGKAYADAVALRTNLQTKITQQQEKKADADELFKQAFAAAGYVVNAAARTALNKKNDAVAILDELNRALTEVQNDLEGNLLLDASNYARSYQNATTNACDTLAEFLVLRALNEHGAPIAQALNSIPSDYRRGTGGTVVAAYGDSLDRAMNKVKQEILLLTQEVGKLTDIQVPPVADLGAMTVQDILSPAEANALRLRIANDG